MNSAAELLAEFRDKGIRIWISDGRLSYRAPKGVLTDHDVERLKRYREEIVPLLHEADARLSDTFTNTAYAPLAFSQRAHWNMYHLRERPAIRQIASATRLSGSLDLKALTTAWGDVVARHDAFRTRIVIRDEEPTQELSIRGEVELPLEDISSFPAREKGSEVIRRITQLIMSNIDMASDSLWSVNLLRLSETEHVMIVAMEHSISDAASLGIVLEQVLSAYFERLLGRRGQPLNVPMQFWNFSVQQRNSFEAWLRTHGEYWSRRMSGCAHVRLAEHEPSYSPPARGWGSISFQINSGLKKGLQEWSRRNRTTLPICVFTAYVALVMRWCKRDDIVVLYQSDGRDTPEIQETVGYLAFPLYLRVELKPSDHFIDLTRRLTEEYCTAYLHADRSYLETCNPKPPFTRNTSFNWIPRSSSGAFSAVENDGTLRIEDIPFEHPMLATMERDTEPSILFREADTDVSGELLFSLADVSRRTIERFSRNLILFLTAIVDASDPAIEEVVLVE